MILQNLQWTARLAGVLLFLFFAAFAAADFPPWTGWTLRQAIYGFGLLSLFAGLPLAWRWPLSGGALTLGGWLLLAGLARSRPMDWPILLPALTGGVHLITGWLLRHRPEPARPAWVRILLLGPLPLFLVLAANEMFGDPPLLANYPQPLSALEGTWTSEPAGVSLTITAAGMVTGTVDGVEITGGHLRPNRSPFGRLIRWRTGYLIRGSAGGSLLSAPCDLTGTGLRGSLVLRRDGQERGRPLLLRRN